MLPIISRCSLLLIKNQKSSPRQTHHSPHSYLSSQSISDSCLHQSANGWVDFSICCHNIYTTRDVWKLLEKGLMLYLHGKGCTRRNMKRTKIQCIFNASCVTSRIFSVYYSKKPPNFYSNCSERFKFR